jgi:ribosome-associated protein
MGNMEDNSQDNSQDESQDESQSKSKTQIKKEADSLQKLGEELTKLSHRQLEGMKLPHDLLKALTEARSIKSNIAARRHRQFIGVLMRDVDPEPIRHALVLINAHLLPESEKEKERRGWKERLLTGDPLVMEAFIHACPGLERQKLSQLLRNIKKEKTKGKSSKSLKILEQLIAKSVKDK